MGERRRPRGGEDSEDSPRDEDQSRRGELKPPLVERKCGYEPGGERQPPAAAEREVERHEKDHGRGARGGTQYECPAACGESEREKHSHGREDPDGVPVTDRGREPVAVGRRLEAQMLGKEPDRKPIRRQHCDRSPHPHKQRLCSDRPKSKRAHPTAATYTMIRSTSYTVCVSSSDQTLETAVQTARPTKAASRISPSAPHRRPAPVASRTAVSTSSPSALQPHETGK